MTRSVMIDLDDCTEWSYALRARPTALAHITTLLLTLMLAAAVAWIATTKVNLVVVTNGRVRSVVEPTQVFTAASTSALSGGAGISGGAGRVAEVLFHEGDPVQQGDVLLRYDTTGLDHQLAAVQLRVESGHHAMDELDRLEQNLSQRFEARHAHAQAQLDQATTQAQRTQEERATAIRLAKLRLDDANDRLAWSEKLTQRRAASPHEYRRATLQAQTALTQWQAAQLPVDKTMILVRREALNAVRKQYEVDRQDLHLKRLAERTRLRKAKIELDRLNQDRRQMVVLATTDGVVVTKPPQIGQIVQPHQPIAEIAPHQAYRFDVTLTSRDIGHVREGMNVKVKLDAYDYQQYGMLTGRVAFVSPDSKSTQNTTDPSGDAVPLYTARITLDAQELRRGKRIGPLKLGMTGQAQIVTERQNLLPVLLGKIRRTISLS